MENIHIIPTDKSSRLIHNDANQLCYQSNKSFKNDRKIRKKFNIYITSSDEEIKEGDWFYDLDTKYVKIKQSWENSHLDFNGKKIILTTDQDLIKDGVQAIDDEFLEWFVKNPSCEGVVVKEKRHFEADKSKRKNPLNGVYYSYKIIIPKEEPTEEAKQRAKNYMSLKGALEPKQVTLEEASWIFNPLKKLDGEFLRDAFVKGAKWQQERMYSEEDMAESFMACWKANVPEGAECKLSFKEWFEQFKKK